MKADARQNCVPCPSQTPLPGASLLGPTRLPWLLSPGCGGPAVSPCRQDACSCSAVTDGHTGCAWVQQGQLSRLQPAPCGHGAPGQWPARLTLDVRGALSPAQGAGVPTSLEHKPHSANRIPETPQVPVAETRSFSCVGGGRHGTTGPTRKWVAAHVGGFLASQGPPRRWGGASAPGRTPQPSWLAAQPPLRGRGQGMRRGRTLGVSPPSRTGADPGRQAVGPFPGGGEGHTRSSRLVLARSQSSASW